AAGFAGSKDDHSQKVSIVPVISHPLPGLPASKSSLPVPQSQKLFVRPVTVQPNVADVQSQIQSIIELNKRTRPAYSSQAAQIQKISEQALIHQKILETLQSRKTVPASNPADIDEVIRLEKIRLIQEQTLRNREAVQSL